MGFISHWVGRGARLVLDRWSQGGVGGVPIRTGAAASLAHLELQSLALDPLRDHPDPALFRRPRRPSVSEWMSYSFSHATASPMMPCIRRDAFTRLSEAIEAVKEKLNSAEYKELYDAAMGVHKEA